MKISFDDRKQLWFTTISQGFTANGKRRRVWLYGKSKAEVTEKLRTALTEVRPENEDGQTMSSFVSDWLADQGRTLNPNTLDRYSRVLEKHFVPYLGKHQVRNLRHDHCREWLRDMKAGPRTAHMAYVVASKLLGDAVAQGKLRQNPLDTLAPPKYSAPDMGERLWSTLDAQKFLNSACRAEDPYVAAYVLAYHLGMRLGEILGLTWGQLDFEKRTVVVDRQVNEVAGKHPQEGPLTVPPKTKAGVRKLVMTTQVKAFLLARRALVSARGLDKLGKDCLVFATRSSDKPPTKTSFAAHWHRAQERAGARKVTFHSLRHLNASLMLRQGVQPLVVQKHHGHSNVRTTMGVYGHVLDNAYEQVQATEMLEKALGVVAK